MILSLSELAEHDKSRLSKENGTDGKGIEREEMRVIVTRRVSIQRILNNNKMDWSWKDGLAYSPLLKVDRILPILPMALSKQRVRSYDGDLLSGSIRTRQVAR